MSHAPLAHDIGLLTVDAWIPENLHKMSKNFFKILRIFMFYRSRSSKLYKPRG